MSEPEVKTNAAGASPAGGGGGWQRWGKPALLASLMLNLLLFGGFVGGYLASHRHGGMGGLAPIERGIIAFVRTLPRDRSQALLQAVEGQRPAFKAGRRELRQSRAAALDVFTAEALDTPALRAALVKASEADDKVQALGSNVFIELAGRMTPAERQAYRVWREAQEPHHRGPGAAGEGREAPGKR